MTVRPEELRNNMIPEAPVTRRAEAVRASLGDQRPPVNAAGRLRPLTTRQATVYGVIRRTYEAVEEPVRVAYLARRLGMKPEAVRHHVEALARKGYLQGRASPVRPN